MPVNSIGSALFFNFGSSTGRAMHMEESVLITGATSGIGEATARLLAEKGYPLILTGRRRERLETLAENLKSATGQAVWTLCFDVRNQEETARAIESIPPTFLPIGILINNAGLASGLDPLHEGDISDWEKMIDTNLKGLLYVTRQIAPMMVARRKGHIVNISSIAGKETYPMGNVYCATKHAVQSLTKAMRLDMLKHGIKVSSVAPGAVHTEFSEVRFHGDPERAEKVYQGFTPLRGCDVAEAIDFILSRPAHVCIDDLLIMPSAQAYSRDFNREP